MGFFQRAKKTVKPFVDIPRWIDAKALIQNGKTIAELTQRIFIPTKATHIETFEEAMRRFNLTEENIQQRIKQFKLYVGIFFGSALLLFGYLIYLLIVSAYMAFFATLGLMLLMLGQAFRYHFWVYQMTQRRLGCSLSEWFKNSILRKKA